uniref:Cytochrome b561 domain-containing protein n=1 Tax=Rhabditophanes sp. KR3021 TaxID=114890 RepID=A0AC35U298_9BILA
MNKFIITSILVVLISSALASPIKNLEEQKHKEMDPKTKALLTKIHGVFFIVAWFFFVVNGVNYLRYYKPMFDDKSLFGQKVWFNIHRIFNFIAVGLMIIGTIVIFIAHEFRWTGPRVGGGSYNSNGKALHALFGILAVGLAVVQVVNSFLRCAPGDKNSLRYIFNWSHRILGIASLLLAVATISLAAKFFGNHFVPNSAPLTVLYVFYGFFIGCIFVNELSTRYQYHNLLMTSLVTFIIASLVTVTWITALIVQ